MIEPEQAIEEFVGEQFIEWLLGCIRQEILSSEALIAISKAKPKPERLKKFILQLFLANEAFFGGKTGDPGFLRFAIANLSESSDPVAESALEILESRRQEELAGHKIENGLIYTRNKERWFRLLGALGIPLEIIEKAEPKEMIRNYISELSDIYSASEWQTAIGAFAAGEQIAPLEYQAVLTMLKNNTSLTDKDLEVLILVINSEAKFVAGTNHILDKIVFDPQTKQLVWQGVKAQLDIHQEFLSALVKYLES